MRSDRHDRKEKEWRAAPRGREMGKSTVQSVGCARVGVGSWFICAGDADQSKVRTISRNRGVIAVRVALRRCDGQWMWLSELFVLAVVVNVAS